MVATKRVGGGGVYGNASAPADAVRGRAQVRQVW